MRFYGIELEGGRSIFDMLSHAVIFSTCAPCSIFLKRFYSVSFLHAALEERDKLLEAAKEICLCECGKELVIICSCVSLIHFLMISCVIMVSRLYSYAHWMTIFLLRFKY